jgi:hypothetical protein
MPVKLVIALKSLLPEAAFYQLVRRVFQIQDTAHSTNQLLAMDGDH